ncbi:DNA-binding transcriptional LysR family regulator [Cytobacillus horneckiae]|uniref:LysR family transcriptional regulator n=1 Tax=Cytobacillus horneckiae TaxID=549687 RepID=A0A2N0ZIS4_9BACI|nr:LysR family transcriptional regulator [Cytobacillus horneckiae]MBN6886623.1 LysR family transcriptional regulator [Cytobacillus horneckiae]MEC1157287.1 LysR family transcriptional regulator [Cytobacillus horneckiae]MED2935832.1 LysR family transcriptional regulator [Cytobacillus horneckiae]PKG29417.1 LysR family transcriptional regulator [Cytobacillus horneckiae]
MDIKQLEVFNTIYKHKNFSKAAQELEISQPTVSAQIKSLEESLGLQLFNRKNKALGNLTDAGKILYPYSSQILSLVKDAETSLSQYKKGYSGSLSLVTSDSFCYWILPQILENFNQRYPAVEITLNTEFTPKMIDMVNNREVHYAVARTGTPHFNDEQLKSESIGQDPIVLVVSTHNRLNRLEKVTVEDLINEIFIVYGKKSNYWSQIEQAFHQFKLEPKTGMELNDINATKKMIEINLGISFLPEISVQDEVKNNRLTMIEIENFPKLYRYSHLIYHKDLIMTGGVEKFLQFIQETKPYTL